MRAHLAEHEGAVAAAERAHAEAVEHARIGKAPVAPRDEAGKIGLEIAGAEPIVGEYRIASEQHAAIPQRRPFAPQLRKMRVDLRAAFVGERPCPWLDREIERADAMNLHHVIDRLAD